MKRMWPHLALLGTFLVSSNCFQVNNIAPMIRAFGLRADSPRQTCKHSFVMQSNRRDGATEEQIKKAYATYEELMRTNNYGKGYWMDSPFQFFINIQQAFRRNFGSEAKANPLDFFSNKPKTVDLSDSPFKPLLSPDDEDLDESPQSKLAEPKQQVFAESSLPVSKPKSKSLKKSSKAAEKTSAPIPPTPSSLNVRLKRVIGIRRSILTNSEQDTEALKQKLAELEAAKKRAEEEAARIKAQLSE